MKIILFCKQFPGLINAWKKNGYDVIQDSECSAEKEAIALKQLEVNSDCEAAFTFDFYPAVAEACHKRGVTYISWVWDCPHVTLWSKTVRYETNRIFVFDYALCSILWERGVKNLWHLPLGMDVDRFEECIKKDSGRQKAKYGHDVAFVGNLYNDTKSAMLDAVSFLPPYTDGYIKGLTNAQRKIWGADLIENGIPEQVWKDVKEYVKFEIGDAYEDGAYEVMFKSMMKRKTSQLERLEMCSALSRLFEFGLYTNSNTDYDPKIKNLGTVDYFTEMPLVFNYSKINIHITIRDIISGVPQRVLDVLACEGFLLTNYQPEIAEYFENGVDLVMYESHKDMYEKIAYYLAHEDERREIAHNGYLKVKELFNYDRQISSIVGCLKADE